MAYGTDRWFFYQCFHENLLQWWIIPLVPVWVHILLDMVTHGTDGWYWWAYILEPILGAASVYALFWIWLPQICVHLPDDFDCDFTEEDIRK